MTKIRMTAGLDQLGPIHWGNKVSPHTHHFQTLTNRCAASMNMRKVKITLPDMSPFMGGPMQRKSCRGLCEWCGHLRNIKQVEQPDGTKKWMCRRCRTSRSNTSVPGGDGSQKGGGSGE